jgi:uncharacterized protein involved in type VI secretion and phage assembly
MSDERLFFGKYRGQVTHNNDTDNLGRIRATVLEVYGTKDSPWALPSVPYAGNNVGVMLIPPVGAWVWFEFEHGKPNTPIWSGCFWGPKQKAPAGSPTKKVLAFDTVTITIDDSQPGQGNIAIETDASCHLSIAGNTIEITNGKGSTIKFSTNTVSINDTALQVT